MVRTARGRPVQWMLKVSEDGGIVVKSYSIISGNEVPTRDHKDWVLEGSQDDAVSVSS